MDTHICLHAHTYIARLKSEIQLKILMKSDPGVSWKFNPDILLGRQLSNGPTTNAQHSDITSSLNCNHETSGEKMQGQ